MKKDICALCKKKFNEDELSVVYEQAIHEEIAKNAKKLGLTIGPMAKLEVFNKRGLHMTDRFCSKCQKILDPEIKEEIREAVDSEQELCLSPDAKKLISMIFPNPESMS